MGLTTNEIATWNDLNSKRLGTSFYTGDNSKHCPTKSEINAMDLLSVQDSPGTAVSISSFTATTSLSTDMNSVRVTPTSSNTISGFQVVASGSTIQLKTTTSTYLYGNNNIACQYDCPWVAYYATSSYLNDMYMFKRTYTITSSNVGKTHRMAISIAPSYGVTTTYGSNFATTASYLSSFNVSYSVLIVYSNGSYYETGISSNSSSLTGYFYFKPEAASFTIYIIPTEIVCNFVLPTTTYNYIGFGILLLSVTLLPYSVFYDNNLCVKYSDIGNSRTFTIYFGIYNAKSSSADLDRVEVFISTSSSYSSGTWESIGKTSISSVSSTKRGTVSCTIPTKYDLTSLLYITVVCGDTTVGQSWSRGEGNIATESNIKNLSFNLVSSSNRKNGYYTSKLQADMDYASSVLNYKGSGTSGSRWRSYSKAVCFKIT